MLRLAHTATTPGRFPIARISVLQAAMLTMLSLAPPLALAAPVDPVVRNGSATFAVNGNVYTVANSPGAIIDWRQFNVGNGELMRFLQQNAQSTVLNRVTGNDPSQILGALQSNGRVLLVNPNGVLFGANATVDVAGLVVSGLRLSDADFLAGKYNFSGGAGAVSNQGVITTPLGGHVYLIGGDVSNGGVIRTPGGQILLAAGQSVSLADSGTPNLSVTLSASGNKALNLGELNAEGGHIDVYGALVDQQGVARADSVGTDAQGRIVLKASDQVSVSGTLSAANSGGTGGAVQVLGDQVSLRGSARIDASGAQGGGSVLIGGDYQGANPAVQNASSTTVEAGAHIDASAQNAGHGGKVVVWSNGLTRYDGTALARGGALGGDGGLVETSGHTLRNNGKVDTRAPMGRTGNWLLDPAVYCFYNANASECASGTDYTVDNINNIGNYLSASNATLQASNYISFLPSGGNGTINPSIPAGFTLNVLAPYIEVGQGANINTNQVGLAMVASPKYGTTSVTDAGVNLTGSIVLRGVLNSNASQSFTADGGNIRLVAENGQSFAWANMTSATGTQTVSASGMLELLLEGGQAGDGYSAQLTSSGTQSISANRILGHSSNTAGSGQVLINTQGGNQTINASDITLTGSAGASAYFSSNGNGAKQLIQAETITLTGGAAGSDHGAFINAFGPNASQQIDASKSITMIGGNGTNNIAAIHAFTAGSNDLPTQKITTGTLSLQGGSGSNTNFAGIYSDGIQTVSAASLQLTAGTVGTHNMAEIDSAQSQTVNVTGALTLNGSGSGSNNYTSLYVGSQNASSGNKQQVSAGAITLQGGVGDGNYAHIWADNLGTTAVAQQVSAKSITLVSGSGTNSNQASDAGVGTSGSQTVVADTLSLTGSDFGAFVRAATDQNITANVALTLQGGHYGGAQNAGSGGAGIFTDGNQFVTAGALQLTGGASGNYSNANIGANGNQIVVAKNVVLSGGSGSSNGASISTGGAQTISADKVQLSAGNQGNDNYAGFNSVLNQTINVSGALTVNAGTAGTNNNAGIGFGGQANSAGAIQQISASSITLQGGTGGTGNHVDIGGDLVQGTMIINTGALLITGGAGDNNYAHIWINNQGATDVTQKVNAKSITLIGGSSASSNNQISDAAIGGSGSQTIVADNITLTGSDTGVYLNAGSDQNITANAALTLQGGHYSGAQNAGSGGASFWTNGNQSVTAGALQLTGGSSGNYNGSNIGNNGNQTISAKSIVLTGGGGSGNQASINTGGTQSISADSVQLGGGNQGTQNFASISSAKDQSINITGAFTLNGGNGDSNTNASVSSGATQTIGADSLQLIGGNQGTVNYASIFSTKDQSFNITGALTLNAGSGGSNNNASVGMGNQGSALDADAKQQINAGSITIQGGAGGTNNFANIEDSGPRVSQSINTAALLIQGGTGDGNWAHLWSDYNGTTAVTQQIKAKSIVLIGGGDSSSNAGNADAGLSGNGDQTIVADSISLTGDKASAFISTNGNQSLAISGSLAFQGGHSGVAGASAGSATLSSQGNQTIVADNITLTSSEANAYIYAKGEQSLTARGNLTLQGGSYSGAADSGGGGADIWSKGNQTINANGIAMAAGNLGVNNDASIGTQGAQTISAGSIVLAAGSAGSNNSADLYATGGDQTINLTGTGPRLSITAGGGTGSSNNYASVGQYGSGQQTIVINGGGSVTLRGGAGDGTIVNDQPGYCSGCASSNNVAAIYNFGGSSQLLDFTAGGTLSLTGGSNGPGNNALILADLSKGAQQTITSSGGAANYPSITLTGGSGGYFNPADGASVANNAAIGSDSQLAAGPASALKTVNAKSITLNGGGTATTHGGALLDTGQGDAVINVSGDLTMTGGASNVALLAATDPTQAYSRDQGATAAINPDGNLTLSVGGNLLMQGGSGASSGALIDANSASGALKLNVSGATRMLAGASSAAILSHTTTSSTDPGGGAVAVDLGSDGSFSTSTFASSGNTFLLNGTLNASGANASAPLLPIYNSALDSVDWKVLGAKNLLAEVYASDSYTNKGQFVTPGGNWLVALGNNAATSADPASAIDYAALNAHGYQWTPDAYNSSNASSFRFLLPGEAPVVDLKVADTAASATCVSNPVMCATPTSGSNLPLAAAPAAVTYDVKLAVADSTPPAEPAPAATPAKSADSAAAGTASAQVGVSGKRTAVREKEEAKAADEKKTTTELKREAQLASGAAKADLAAARKVEQIARKDAGNARAAATAAAKVEAAAKRADADAQRAGSELKATAAAVTKAEAEVRSAPTPQLKAAALAHKAEAESRRAGLEARLAEANAKKAEAGAKRSEAVAQGSEADARGLEAGGHTAAAEAKQAEAARSEALLQARAAKTPQQRAIAERVAEDKRADATQKNADSRIQLAQAEDLHLAANHSKAQADASRAQAQASALQAQAKREEAQLQKATARSQQEEAQLQRAIASGKPELVRQAQARKAAAERQLAAQSHKAEARQAAAAAKAEEAKAKQAKADQGAQEVAQRDQSRRLRAAAAFAAGATASMSSDQLAERAALRHAYKTEVFKDALNILSQNNHAADLPVCSGANAAVCVPPLQLQAQLQAQAGQLAAGHAALRTPTLAFLPQIQRKVALVIGINNYQDKRIVGLESAVPDAEAVAAQMADAMGYEVHLLRDPTKADIVNNLGALSRELGPSDSVAVYYAGHGYMANNAKTGKQGYWIPADAASNSPANWISTRDVGRLLAAIPARQVMLVSDSCYSGTFAEEQQLTGSGQADASQILARRSVVVMSSGGEEPVADDGVDGHSIFAWSLMQSIKDVSRYTPGVSVFGATKARVIAAYPQVPQYGAALSAGHTSGGDYLFEARRY